MESEFRLLFIYSEAGVTAGSPSSPVEKQHRINSMQATTEIAIEYETTTTNLRWIIRTVRTAQCTTQH